MKIDIGPHGKILGTKRVSNNGQVSGFTEYAGQEVLVILPGAEQPVVHRDARDVLSEVETVVHDQMQLAFRQYETLKKRFKTPEHAAQAFLKRTSPKALHGLIEKTDLWVREQAAAVETRVQEGLKRARKASTRRPKED